MDYYKSLFIDSNCDSIKSNALSLTYGAQSYKLIQNEDRSKIQSIISKISFSNFSVKKRRVNLSLLLTILPQCDSKLLSENVEVWFRMCIQIIKKDIKSCERLAALEILTFILKQSKNNQLLKQKQTLLCIDRNLVNHLCSKFEQESVTIASLKCLYELVCNFPSAIFKVKDTIEDHLYSFLTCPLTSEPTLVKWAARVFWAIPAQRMNGCTDSESRGKQMTGLISFIHESLDVLFKGVKDDQSYSLPVSHSIPTDSLILESEDPIAIKLNANQLVSNSLIFLGEIFFWSTSQFVSIPVKTVLTVIFRILVVERQIIEKLKGQEMDLLALLLPFLHQRALLLLQNLIESKCCVLFYGMILEQLIATIQSTYQRFENDNSGKKVQGEIVKTMAYKVLAILVQTSGGCLTIPHELAKFLIADIRTTTKKFVFQNAKLNEAKKAKKKGFSGTIDGSTQSKSDSLSDIGMKVPVTMAALTLIKALFTYSQHSMPNKMVKNLGQNLLECGKNPYLEAYSCSTTRALLFEAILSYARRPHPMFLVPYEEVFHILLITSKDSDPKVSMICNEGVNTLSFIGANPQVSKMSDFLRFSNSLRLKESTESNEEENGMEDLAIEPDLSNRLLSLNEKSIEPIFNARTPVSMDDDNMDQTLSDIDESRVDIDESRIDIDESRIDIDESRIDIDESRIDIDESRIDIDQESSQENLDLSLKNSDPEIHQEEDNVAKLNGDHLDEDDIPESDIVLLTSDDSNSDLEEVEVMSSSTNKKSKPKRVIAGELLKKRKATPFKGTEKKSKLDEGELSLNEMMASLVESDSD